jgi:hypothetical protein
MKPEGYIFAALFFLSVGFMLGHLIVPVTETTTVEYKQLPTVHVSVSPQPFSVSIPDVPAWIFFTDTVINFTDTVIFHQVIDTVAILNDWIKKREYAARLIDDSTGTIDYTATVQYNQLRHIGIDYTPKQRTETNTRTIERQFTPFVFIGGNTAGYGSVEGGIFFKKYGASIELGSSMQGTGYFGAKVGMKF